MKGASFDLIVFSFNSQFNAHKPNDDYSWQMNKSHILLKKNQHYETVYTIIPPIPATVSSHSLNQKKQSTDPFPDTPSNLTHICNKPCFFIWNRYLILMGIIRGIYYDQEVSGGNWSMSKRY